MTVTADRLRAALRLVERTCDEWVEDGLWRARTIFDSGLANSHKNCAPFRGVAGRLMSVAVPWV
jgi:hypothetical protein